MRTPLALTAAVTLVTAVALGGCSTEGQGPVTSVEAVTEAPTPTIPDPEPGTVGPTRVAVEYAEAMRARDAGALYDLASRAVQGAETREEYIERLDLSTVTNARLSGTVKVGWTEAGLRLAVAPVIVTADGLPQPGRIVLLREDGDWRYVDAVPIGSEPDLLAERPATPRR